VDKHFISCGSDFLELSVDEILISARYLYEKHGIKGLLIDPFNYIDKSGDGFMSETDYVSKFLSRLRQFAKETGCHVWLVAHPVKNNKWTQKTPTLYDIAGSAHFLNKCDMGVVVERNRDPEEGQLNEVRIQVEKVRNREAGQVGSTKLWFDWRTRRYSEEPIASHVCADAHRRQLE